MKLSAAILVSVNLVATMPASAQAAESTVSDKAEWLKSNLAAMGPAPAQTQRKVSLSDAGLAATRQSIKNQAGKPAAKIRSFIANRRLPSRRELDAAAVAQRPPTYASMPPLVAQQPTMGQVADYPLSGQVSAYALQTQPTPSIAKSYPAGLGYQQSASRVPTHPAQRAIPNQVPTLPGQVASVPPQMPAIPSMPVIPEPPTAQPAARPLPNPQFAAAQLAAQRVARVETAREGERCIRQSGALLVQTPVMCAPPALTADQQAMLNELESLNRPGKSTEFVDLPGSPAQQVEAVAPSAPANMMQTPRSMSYAQGSYAQAPMATAAATPLGPPPFPLNLLPAEALTGLTHRSQRRRTDAPPAYFGSWHRPIVAHAGGFANPHLPAGGFRAYAQPRIDVSSYSHYAPSIASATNSARRKVQSVRKSRKYSAAAHHESASHTAHTTHTAHTSYLAAPRVFMYPAYEGHGRTNMF